MTNGVEVLGCVFLTLDFCNKLISVFFSESPNPTEATQTDAGDLQRMRTQTSPINIYYRTVPLDDCGITDNETPRFVPTLSLNLVEDSDNNGNPVLSESLVVHAGDNSDDSATLGKDYKVCSIFLKKY